MRLHFEEGEREVFVARLGLDENAEDEQIIQAMGQWLQEDPDATDNNTNNETGEGIDASQGDVVIIDVASFRRLQQRDRVAGQVEETMRRRDRDDLIAEAVHDGKISPGRADHYRTRYDDDPEGISQLLGRLTPNTVPLEELGTEASQDQEDQTAYPADWVPDIAARQQRQTGRVHGEE
jgi:hypothetical protein